MTATGRVARWSATHRWWVLLASLLVLVAAVGASATLTPVLQTSGDGAGESQVATDLFNEKYPPSTESTEQLLFSHPDLTVDSPSYQATVERLVAELEALPQVKSVAGYYEAGGPAFLADDGHVTRAVVTIDREVKVDGHRADAILNAVGEASARHESDDFTISIAGGLTTSREINEMVDEDFGQIMIISLSLGLIIMILAFGALVAALIPLFLAVAAIMIASGLAVVFSQWYALNESYSEMILLLGLAVGIDYSLFIVSRFRKERQAGRAKLEAITAASSTTGRAVFYAGVTVLVSLFGLVITGQPIFVSLALGAIFVVFVTIIGSLTFLPAVLSVVGDNVNRLHVPFLGRDAGNGIWAKITDKVMRRPAIYAGVTLALLIALAAPAADLNLGFPSGSKALNDAVEAKQAMVLLEDHFTGGLTAPAYILVVADDVRSDSVESGIAALIEGMESAPQSFFGPFERAYNEVGDAVYLVVPVSGVIDEATRAVQRLRDEIIPVAFVSSDAQVMVTGDAAVNKDFREFVYEKAPIVFAFVLGIAFLLLLVMFRSIVIPIKSILLNLLSVGAAYGVLVMVFQWGWGVELLGSESSGVVLTWLPLFLFAILFGLSMDYHMLLLNRVKESYDESGDNDDAVSSGIRLTAGQITSAAAIMVGVFGAFALGREVGLQQFGVGLGVSILIDATVIRSVLLPATMKLLGDWNWYLPSWLEWLPKVSTSEGHPNDERVTSLPHGAYSATPAED